MNLKTFVTILLIFVFVDVFPQSIMMALNANNDYVVKPEPKVEKIKSTIKKYNIKDGTEHLRRGILKFNDHNRLLEEKHYIDKYGKSYHQKYKYDSSGTKKLKHVIKAWIGVSKSENIIKYEYNENGHLIRVFRRFKAGEIYSDHLIKNNKKGHPIESKFYMHSHKEFQTAKYDYQNNEVIVQDHGKLRRTDTLLINPLDVNKSFQPKHLKKINKRNNFDHIYKYDEHFNWIERTVYKTVNGERKIYSITNREIFYVN